MIFNERRNEVRKGTVTLLSGGDMKVSRYTFSAGEVHSKDPPVETGTAKSFDIFVK
jgi:hypothetical protein